MKKYIVISIVVLTLLGMLFVSHKMYLKEKRERIRQQSNVETLMTNVKHYKVSDSLNAVSVASLNLNVSELKKYRAGDVALIKELKLKPGRVDYITKYLIETKDSLVYVIQPSDSCFHYKSKWLQVDACIRDSSMYISSKDSIAQIFHREYKHKFLFLKWGTKGFKQEIINFNPHSVIRYPEFIELN